MKLQSRNHQPSHKTALAARDADIVFRFVHGREYTLNFVDYSSALQLLPVN
jgi:hypothetical protein